MSELPEFDDAMVQVVYEILCSNENPPNPEEHWEGWVARRIIQALRNSDDGRGLGHA